MMLRFLLVGAVASLGFDLPQGIDVDAWTHSGRAWWHARVAEFEARHGVAPAGTEGTSSPVPPGASRAPAPDGDAAFATVIEDVVAAFAVDGTSDRIGAPDASNRLVAGVEDACYGPDFADALNRWADGLSEPAEPALLAFKAGGTTIDPGTDPIEAPISGFAGSAFEPEVGQADDAPALASLADPSAGDADEVGTASPAPDERRLAEAVQLTGQALKAWLALVQPAGPTFPPGP